MYLEFAQRAVDDLLAHAFDDDESYQHYLKRAERAVRKATIVKERRTDPRVAEDLAARLNAAIRGSTDGAA